MALRLTGTIVERPRRRPQQLVTPWGTYCCAEAARAHGVSWSYMARRWHKAGWINKQGGLRHVRVSPADVARLVRDLRT